MTGDAVIELIAGAPGRDRRRRRPRDPRAALRGVGRPGGVPARRPHRRRGQRRADAVPGRPAVGSPDEPPAACPLRLARREVRRRPGPHRARRAARRPARGGHGHGRHPHPHGRRDVTARGVAAHATARPTRPAYEPDVDAGRAARRARGPVAVTTHLRCACRPPTALRAGRRGHRPPARRPADGRHPRPGRRAGPPTATGRSSSRPRLADELGRRRRRRARARPPELSRVHVVGVVEQAAASAADGRSFAPGPAPGRRCRRRRSADTFLLVDLPDDLSAAELSELERRGPAGNLTRPGAVRSCETTARRRARRGGALEPRARRGRAHRRGHRDLRRLRGRRPAPARHARPAVGQRRVARARVRTALVLQGTVTGLVGAVVGLALAAAAARCSVSRWSSGSSTTASTATTCAVGELVAVAVIGVAAATVAALIPARTAARVPDAGRAGRAPTAAPRCPAGSSPGASPA